MCFHATKEIEEILKETAKKRINENFETKLFFLREKVAWINVCVCVYVDRLLQSLKHVKEKLSTFLLKIK